MNCTIYDYETLGQNTSTLPVLAVAFLQFDTARFVENPYTFEELVDAATEYKFDVAEQVEKYGRKVEMDTVKWWQEQDAVTRENYFKPAAHDISIDQLPAIFAKHCTTSETMFTRGNTFDPIVTESLMKALGQPYPYDWWKDRDTRSFIDGMAYGSGLNNKFIPEGLEDKFIAHDASHDIAMDVMRLQMLAQAIS